MILKKHDMEALFYEAEQRIKWYINGMGQHGLSPKEMANLTTERLCELYNVEMDYFKK